MKKCTSFEEQKGTRYIWENVYFDIFFSCLLSTKLSQISFELFCSGDKRLLSEFLWKWGWFQGPNERLPKYLGKKLKFQELETQFCRWKSTDNIDINIFLSLENACTILLVKEKTWKCIFNADSELLQNCAEKQIMPFKTSVNWLFSDIWCYLAICYFVAKFSELFLILQVYKKVIKNSKKNSKKIQAIPICSFQEKNVSSLSIWGNVHTLQTTLGNFLILCQMVYFWILTF